jgi:hypothetical protein
MLVVVQTYPAHFYQTVACLESIRAQVYPIDRVVLIVDDRSQLAWDGYLKDSQTQYSRYVDEIIPTLNMSCLRFLYRHPWVRQQTAKLLLDTVIDADEWLFIDGDIRLIDAPPVDKVAARKRPYVGVALDERDPRPGEMSSQILFYISHMLGFDFHGFRDPEDDNIIITTSHPPVHVMRAEVLRQLRAHIEKRFGSTLALIHKNIAHDTRMAVSEWDLIECFRQIVLGEPANWHWGDEFCTTTWSSDKELGSSWFEQQGIVIDPKIWRVLPEVKYL